MTLLFSLTELCRVTTFETDSHNRTLERIEEYFAELESRGQ